VTATATARADAARLRLRIYATDADEPRARRASDVTLLVSTVVALAATAAAARPTPGFVRSIDRFARTVPDFLDPLWQYGLDATALLAVGLLVAAIVRRRAAVGRDLVLAAGLAVGTWMVVGRTVGDGWPDLWPALRASAPPPWFPSVRVAVPAAVVLTASPHVVAPLRRLGRWAIAASAVAVVVLGAASSLGALAGFLVAVVAAAAVHLAFGSSAGRPSVAAVAADLAELGIAASQLEPADRQQAGLFLLRGHAADGGSIEVKVYGRDAHDSAVLATLWRTIWYRDSASPLRVGRLQQVEHEAFVTLLAAQSGVVTDAVVTAGATNGDDAVLVLRPSGSAFDAAAPPAGFLDALWRLVARLHDAGLAHGEIDGDHLIVDGSGRLGIRDLRGATAVASGSQRTTDLVQALVTSVAVAGVPAALAAARRHLGDERLAGTLAFLQPAVLTPAQRRSAAAGALDLRGLREAVAAAIGADVPALHQLRRLTPGAILRVLLPAVAVVALLSLLAGLDAGEVADLAADASWWLLAAGLVAAQVPRLTQAVSTAGAAPVPIPLGPLYALQLAVSYVNLVIPSAAGRITVNIRFFQRHGVAPGAALAAGALDGFAGFAVQAAVLASLLLFTTASLDLDLGRAVDGTATLLLLVAVIAVVAIGIVVVVPRLRRFVVHWVRRLATEAVQGVRGLRSPRRLAMLLGGNLATEVLFASVLGVFVLALGHSVGLGALLLTNISVALLSGLLPVPGGIGVAEGGLTLGLVQAGVPEEAAFAAVLAYRLSTFYLPPLWGYAAMRWLERNDHL
jgi:uncharacterized membrane protein YbhN (UPF0104 family)